MGHHEAHSSNDCGHSHDHEHGHGHAHSHSPWEEWGERGLVILAGITLVLGGWLEGHVAPGILVILWTICYLSGGFFGARSAVAHLKKGEVDVDLLMLLAALGALVVGAPFEGAMLLFLFALSHQLQEFAMGRTHRAIEGLAKLRPKTARILKGSEAVEKPLEAVSVGDRYRLRPGEQAPLDGVVLEGDSQLDQSSVTGESMPVHATAGSTIFAGTQNLEGALTVEVTKVAADSTLARMITLVEEAQHRKASAQRFLEAAEQRYALGVIAFTAFLIFVLPTIFGLSWEDGFYRAITVMVVASPCALVISTPATILSAIANGARHGILFKGGAQLEKASRIRTIAFDKTGTLTVGEPRVADSALVKETDSEAFWGAVSALEADSGHPLARALREAAKQHSQSDFGSAQDYTEHTGSGVSGRLDGKCWAIGKPRWLAPEGQPEALIPKIADWTNNGNTIVFVARRSSENPTWEVVGACAIADPVRPDAAQVVQSLREAGVEDIVMLTGDAAVVGASIARQVGLTRAETDLLPEDKVRLVKDLAERGETAMVGDGTNDAPALATASLGVAMGAAGSDIAMESADVVLMANDLTKVPHILALSRAARHIVRQNLIFAGGVIVVMALATLFLPLLGEAYTVPLPLGVLAHEGGTVLVCLNGLRLLGFRS